MCWILCGVLIKMLCIICVCLLLIIGAGVHVGEFGEINFFCGASHNLIDN